MVILEGSAFMTVSTTYHAFCKALISIRCIWFFFFSSPIFPNPHWLTGQLCCCRHYHLVLWPSNKTAGQLMVSLSKFSRQDLKGNICLANILGNTFFKKNISYRKRIQVLQNIRGSRFSTMVKEITRMTIWREKNKQRTKQSYSFFEEMYFLSKTVGVDPQRQCLT